MFCVTIFRGSALAAATGGDKKLGADAIMKLMEAVFIIFVLYSALLL